MKALGTLRGFGKVVSGDITVSNIEYLLMVYRECPGGLVVASGALYGNRQGLEVVFQTRRSTLHTDDGETFDFIAQGLGPDRCDVVVSGPLPGFMAGS